MEEKKKKILVVDDDPDVVEVLRIVLTSAGYEFHCAMNSQAAIDKLHQVKPDLLILDIIMEDRSSGYQVAQEVRSDPSMNGLPIIMLTAMERETGLRLLKAKGMTPPTVDVYMNKPIEPAKLLQEIKGLLEK